MPDFGWSYPAGCSSTPGDEDYNEDYWRQRRYTVVAKVNDKTYRVRFCYPEDKQGRRVTQCEIYEDVTTSIGMDDEELLNIGKAVCSKHDNFNRVSGRKIALTNALKPFDKDTRTAIWEQYKSTCNYIS